MSLASLEGPLGVADVSFLMTVLRGLGVLETIASSRHVCGCREQCASAFHYAHYPMHRGSRAVSSNFIFKK